MHVTKSYKQIDNLCKVPCFKPYHDKEYKYNVYTRNNIEHDLS